MKTLQPAMTTVYGKLQRLVKTWCTQYIRFIRPSPAY